MTTVQPLKDKVIVVTGAGRGIGRAIAIAYARAGAIVACAARTQREIDDTVADICAEGGNALAVQTDVSNLDSVSHLFETVSRNFKGIDIVVINAGVNDDHRRVEETDPSIWRHTLDINLLGAYYCARTAIPYLKARGSGKIITVGSGLGHRGIPSTSAYACSKAGLWMLTRILAQELWADKISVNELVPGPVVTAITDHQASSLTRVPGFESEWIKTPEDVVPMALFLATQPDIGPTAQSFSLTRRDNSG